MCELEPMFNLAVPSGCSNERYRSNCSGGSSTRGKNGSRTQSSKQTWSCKLGEADQVNYRLYHSWIDSLNWTCATPGMDTV